MTIDELSVGNGTSKTYTLTDRDIELFGEVSHDHNLAHFDDGYAAGTIFKGRIAHGTLSVGIFSGIFGMDMPGLGAIWASQQWKFLAPVYPHRPYTAHVEVVAKDEKTATFRSWVTDADGNTVLEGENVLRPIPAKVKAKLNLSQLLDQG